MDFVFSLFPFNLPQSSLDFYLFYITILHYLTLSMNFVFSYIPLPYFVITAFTGAVVGGYIMPGLSTMDRVNDGPDAIPETEYDTLVAREKLKGFFQGIAYGIVLGPFVVPIASVYFIFKIVTDNPIVYYIKVLLGKQKIQ